MADTSLLIEESSRWGRWPKYMAAAVSSWFGSLALGTVVGYTANAGPSLQSEGSHVPLTTDQLSWLGSLMALGAVFGSICAGSSIERIGRKGTLIVTSVPFVFGWLLMAYAGHWESSTSLLIGRFITGFCCGLVSLAAPVYIAETAAPAMRGFLGSGFQLSISTGVLVSFIAGKYLSWAYLAVLSAVFPVLLLMCMCLMPETPYWLIRRGRILEATEANVFLHGLDVTQHTVIEQSIGGTVLSSTGSPERSVRIVELSQRHVLRPLLLTLALMLFQQTSGVNALLFFTTDIFGKSGSHSLAPTDATIIVGAVQVLAAVTACLLTDRAGRKPLLIVSSIGCGLSVLSLSVFHFVADAKGQHFQQEFSWIPVVALISFMVTFSLGLGPIPWLLMGELLPAHVRNVASGLCSAANWLFAFLITKLFHTLLDTMQESGTYLLFSVLCFTCAVFVAALLPETKGKSLAEIEAIFKRTSDDGMH
ncbi:unnamed protein product [Medioppia subpectinata]|uniref:Major facilitator superfamily (MFS) profile domain-containing protein n=1 Tax=Medioppia subpectinata TaxID=1979941 RepID=A0A7R9KFQ9_9ACAR|nr:unnamed protein product [Medioppia subpectinata]CAG2101501.1 unnamed protein product [Medioppia subpectinata]